jgi:hypothetical protein
MAQISKVSKKEKKKANPKRPKSKKGIFGRCDVFVFAGPLFRGDFNINGRVGCKWPKV